VGDGFTWETQNRQADMARARAGWTLCKALVDACRGEAPAYELVIMDELHIVLRYDYLPTDEIVAFLATKPRDLHICTTGRDAPQALIDIADTVTEMRAVKHAYDAGVKAQKGVE